MTPQIHERLILEGRMTSMACTPPLPDSSRLQESSSNELILSSAACTRGYQGTWEIKDGQFYLIDLRGRVQLRESAPLLADWFSGVLRVPKGNPLNVLTEFGRLSEQEDRITIQNGVVVETRTVDNTGDGDSEGEQSVLPDEFRSGGTRTTQIGFINRNDQECRGTRGVAGTDHGQRSYKMLCRKASCGNVYGANGTDVHLRKCPDCQKGKPGIAF